MLEEEERKARRGERGAPAAEGSLLLFTPLYVTCTAKPSKIRKRDVMKATVVPDSCATSPPLFFFSLSLFVCAPWHIEPPPPST